MFQEISTLLEIPEDKLAQRASRTLKSILHNYAFFDISTIDGFNHRLVRTFAKDLKLPVGFDVELDADAVLKKTVDLLLDSAGEDDALTAILIDFSLSKAGEDKSWDIARDLYEIARLLNSENDLHEVKKIKEKTLADFGLLKSLLTQRTDAFERSMRAIGAEALSIIHESGVPKSSFSYNGELPNHFVKLTKKQLDKLNFSGRLHKNLIENESYYATKTPEHDKSVINSIIEPLKTLYLNSLQEFDARGPLYFQDKKVLRNITPLSVLNLLQNTLKELEETEGLLLISDFNTIIAESIKNEPAPFIYERLGERYRHYFIDEFQDTSILQWRNLQPLIDHALSSEASADEPGSLLLVGDAKQSIYRWRGGKAEQFIGLLGKDNPFHIEKHVTQLPKNYRSEKQVVSFNNDFYRYMSDLFEAEIHKKLYRRASQDFPAHRQGGYVQLSFIEANNKAEAHERYPNEVIRTIRECQEQGFELSDICILTRRREEGVVIAKALAQQGIPLVSSETLLLKNSEDVLFLVDMLKFLTRPDDLEAKAYALYYVADRLKSVAVSHFIAEHIPLSLDELFESIKAHGIPLDFNLYASLPLYEAIEYLASCLGLLRSGNSYIVSFLEFAFEISQKRQHDTITLLDQWEMQKEKLSVSLSEDKNAVQVMTIHKAKGLEFPIVIFPYADQSLGLSKDAKAWLKVNKDLYAGFEDLLMPVGRYLTGLGDAAEQLYEEEKQRAFFDNINLLYVTTTRAVEQMYILGKLVPAEPMNSFSSLFISYLMHLGKWEDGKRTYSFGFPEKSTHTYRKNENTYELNKLISVPKESHQINILTKSGKLWGTKQEAAIERGNTIHELLARIDTKEDVGLVIAHAVADGLITQAYANEITPLMLQVVSHPELSQYYSDGYTAYNERDLITSQGQTQRADRIVVKGNDAVIIDYKTGEFQHDYQRQLRSYASTLTEMGMSVKKMLLVFIGEDVTVQHI